MAVDQSGRASPLGQAEERPAGCGPVQTANQTAAEERLRGFTWRSDIFKFMILIFRRRGALMDDPTITQEVALTFHLYVWLQKRRRSLTEGPAPTPL